jgi:hypothetical protein
MNLFSFLRPDRLADAWSYDAAGMVWRLLFADHGRIVGECRDREKKIASFFCLDEETGKPLWQGVTIEEPWWVGIEVVLHDTLLLHTYASPDMPEHRGIRALDVETGALRWRNDDLVYWFGSGEKICAYRDFFEKRVGYELDLRTGEIVAIHEESLQKLHDFRSEAGDSEAVPELTAPEILDDDSGDASIRAFVSRLTSKKRIVGSIEFILQDGILAFNYHVRSSNNGGDRPALDNHLCVYRFPKGERLFDEAIARNLVAAVPDSFFIRKTRLFFIRDQQTLTALRLWK